MARQKENCPYLQVAVRPHSARVLQVGGGGALASLGPSQACSEQLAQDCPGGFCFLRGGVGNRRRLLECGQHRESTRMSHLHFRPSRWVELVTITHWGHQEGCVFAVENGEVALGDASLLEFNRQGPAGSSNGRPQCHSWSWRRTWRWWQKGSLTRSPRLSPAYRSLASAEGPVGGGGGVP